MKTVTKLKYGFVNWELLYSENNHLII